MRWRCQATRRVINASGVGDVTGVEAHDVTTDGVLSRMSRYGPDEEITRGSYKHEAQLAINKHCQWKLLCW